MWIDMLFTNVYWKLMYVSVVWEYNIWIRGEWTSNISLQRLENLKDQIVGVNYSSQWAMWNRGNEYDTSEID